MRATRCRRGTLRYQTEMKHCRLPRNLKKSRRCSLDCQRYGKRHPPELLARIFEPVLHNQGTWQRTGLGLAMVYGTVSQSGGRIDRSAPGKGTTFKIYFPATDELVSTSSRETRSAAKAGVRTILFVEDGPV